MHRAKPSRRVIFSAGIVLGILIGAGGMAIAYARRRTVMAVTPEPVQAAPPTLPEPWPGYEASKVDDIKWMLRPLSLAEREAVRTYEQGRETGPRRGIVNVLNALEEERANGNA